MPIIMDSVSSAAIAVMNDTDVAEGALAIVGRPELLCVPNAYLDQWFGQVWPNGNEFIGADPEAMIMMYPAGYSAAFPPRKSSALIDQPVPPAALPPALNYTYVMDPTVQAFIKSLRSIYTVVASAGSALLVLVPYYKVAPYRTEFENIATVLSFISEFTE